MRVFNVIVTNNCTLKAKDIIICDGTIRHLCLSSIKCTPGVIWKILIPKMACFISSNCEFEANVGNFILFPTVNLLMLVTAKIFD